MTIWTNIIFNLDKYAEQTNKQSADDASSYTALAPPPVNYMYQNMNVNNLKKYNVYFNVKSWLNFKFLCMTDKSEIPPHVE